MPFARVCRQGLASTIPSILMHAIIANPSAYGFTDVTDPCFNGATVCSDRFQILVFRRFSSHHCGQCFCRARLQRSAVPETSTFVFGINGPGCMPTLYGVGEPQSQN